MLYMHRGNAAVEKGNGMLGIMKRTKIALLVLAFSTAVAPLAFSQNGGPQPCPEVSPGALGCQLIAWSQLQEPAPLPEPDAKTAPPDQQPDPQPTQPTTAQQAEPQASLQTISGIIVREGEKYVLKAGDNTTYQLDDQDSARKYQDKQVKVVGRLDAGSNTLHIQRIELAS
jgi:Protein of unknown function (DUF5818)